MDSVCVGDAVYAYNGIFGQPGATWVAGYCGRGQRNWFIRYTDFFENNSWMNEVDFVTMKKGGHSRKHKCDDVPVCFRF